MAPDRALPRGPRPGRFRRLAPAAVCCAALIAGACGCVRRTVRFTSEPAGARVFLNDREIGRTPATVDFTWYGDYDVIYRLQGHRTLKTHLRLDAPLYQRFPLDLFTELLWPGEIHDHHDAPVVALEAAEPVEVPALLQRAAEMRARALAE